MRRFTVICRMDPENEANVYSDLTVTVMAETPRAAERTVGEFLSAVREHGLAEVAVDVKDA